MRTFIDWAYFIFLIVVYVGLLTVAYGALSAAPWVPTKKRERQRLGELLPLKDGAVIYDLGCGDARLLFDMLDCNPRVEAIGMDVALPVLLVAWLRRLSGHAKYRNLALRWKDFFRADISDADIVFVFLLPRAYSRVTEFLVRQVKDSCLIVFEAWPVADVLPLKVSEGKDSVSFYLYDGRQLRASVPSPEKEEL